MALSACQPFHEHRGEPHRNQSIRWGKPSMLIEHLRVMRSKWYYDLLGNILSDLRSVMIVSLPARP